MSNRDKVLEEYRNVSSKITDLCRNIGFGLVAVVYSIFTSDSKAVNELYSQYSFFLLLVALFGVLTIILEYFQFLGGYFSVKDTLKNHETDCLYDENLFWYKLRDYSFFLKQGTAIFGAVILFFIIIASSTI
jgi:hypothetical protein